MGKKYDSFSSRSERRKKSSFDRFLNWAIGVVIVLIVLIGAYLLINILNSPNDSASTKDNTQQEDTQSSKTKDQANDNNTGDSGQNSDDNVVSNNDTADSDTSDTAQDNTDEGDDSTTLDGGGPEGPWEPVGTTQTEPHQTNYDEGSKDWNERLKALSYATGISEDNMTLLWLGNGGSPDKSLGKVKEKGTNKVYDVVLQWVTDKGWKPISVDVE